MANFQAGREDVTSTRYLLDGQPKFDTNVRQNMKFSGRIVVYTY
jgi:hypothetical protein